MPERQIPAPTFSIHVFRVFTCTHKQNVMMVHDKELILSRILRWNEKLSHTDVSRRAGSFCLEDSAVTSELTLITKTNHEIKSEFLNGQIPGHLMHTPLGPMLWREFVEDESLEEFALGFSMFDLLKKEEAQTRMSNSHWIIHFRYDSKRGVVTSVPPLDHSPFFFLDY